MTGQKQDQRQPPDDWLALRAIYGCSIDSDDEYDDDDKDDNIHGDGGVRFIGRWVTTTSTSALSMAESTSATPQQKRFFCGTVYITVSSSASSASSALSSVDHDAHHHHSQQQQQKISYARLVNEKTGDYRYFQLQRLPSVRLELMYDVGDDGGNMYDLDDYDTDCSSYGPISVHVEWDHYPIEWPVSEKSEFLSFLQRQCESILNETAQQQQGGFPICEFLEHDMISSYGRRRLRPRQQSQQHEEDSLCGVRHWTLLRLGGDDAATDCSHEEGLTIGDDEYNPNRYQIMILPPESDKMYHENYGTLLNPKQQAAIVSRTVRRSNILKKSSKSAENIKRNDNKNQTTSKRNNGVRRIRTVPLYAHCNKNDLLDFTRHALIECWKQLYTTSCPVCLEDNLLYDDGITFKKCQHYCCHDCFKMYLSHKVADLAQYRTNPFLCPVETCTDRELPFATICRRFLGPEEHEQVAKWYKDLTFPPCWSLDRCLNVKDCGVVGSMRRKPMPSKKKSSHSIEKLTPTRTQIQTYNYHGVHDDYDGGPPVGMGGFFHHGVMTPVDVEQTRRKDEEKKILDEIKRRTQVNALSTSSSSLICCERCNTTWCELCLNKINEGGEHDHYDRKNNGSTVSTRCQPQAALQFCRKYLSASEDEKEEIRSKFPWIVSYATFCEHDGAAVEYLQENGGQRCPNCRTGVERMEGCFHIKCLTCATHFCYECGDELFPPYYGTHHCWEEGGTGREQQNRQDEELAVRLMLQEALGEDVVNFDL